MSQLVPFQPNQLPSIFQGIATDDASLSENVGAKFAVASIKGKVFRIKHNGTEVPLMVTHQGQQYAAPYFDVIIPKANPNLSKTYYKDQFAEGTNESPDCWSEDGIHPLAVPPISPDCRICPFNQFGSKVSTDGQGSRGKACADTRKIAIVPADNIDNERFEGPMLLRVPAASLGTLADYDRMLKSHGVPFYAVVTRISFDASVAYPKLVFTPIRVLTDEEAGKIVDLRSDLRVDQVINSPQASSPQAPDHPVPAAPAAPAQPAFFNPEQVPVAQQPAGIPVAPPAAPPPAFVPPPASPVPLTPPPMTVPPAPTQAPTTVPSPVPFVPPVQTEPLPSMQGQPVGPPPPAFVPPQMPSQAGPPPAAPAPAVTSEFLSGLDKMLAQ